MFLLGGPALGFLARCLRLGFHWSSIGVEMNWSGVPPGRSGAGVPGWGSWGSALGSALGGLQALAIAFVGGCQMTVEVMHLSHRSGQKNLNNLEIYIT